MNKREWLEIGEILDALRVMPRVILISVIVFTGWYIVRTTEWYLALPADERQYTDAGLLGLTIPALFGLAGKICQWYLQTGRKWEKSE